MTELRYEITIRASSEVIYRHLTEREGLLRWIGVDASADPVPGGDLTWTHDNGATMIGRFIELDPPARLVFAYGWKDDLMGVPPESTIVEIQLREEPGHTLLVLTHRGLTENNAKEHGTGWDYFLTKLHQLLANPTHTPEPPATAAPAGSSCAVNTCCPPPKRGGPPEPAAKGEGIPRSRNAPAS